MYNRIFIVGGTGSGKTTLAKQLSKILRIHYYSTDDFIYKKKWETKYSEKERDNKVKAFANKEKWIIEGVHGGEWMSPLFKKAELVIILLINKLVLFKRITKRSIKRRRSNTPDSIRDTIKLLYWAHIYKKDKFLVHKQMIGDYKKRFIVLRSNKEIKNFLNSLYS